MENERQSKVHLAPELVHPAEHLRKPKVYAAKNGHRRRAH